MPDGPRRPGVSGRASQAGLNKPDWRARNPQGCPRRTTATTCRRLSPASPRRRPRPADRLGPSQCAAALPCVHRLFPRAAGCPAYPPAHAHPFSDRGISCPASITWKPAPSGCVQGVTELFPISSLGHSILLPAFIGGSWKADLDMTAKDSPYLAFLVLAHVATALALVAFFWRDWVRIIRGPVLLDPAPQRGGPGRAAGLAAGDRHDPGRPDRHRGGQGTAHPSGQTGAGGGVPARQRLRHLPRGLHAQERLQGPARRRRQRAAAPRRAPGDRRRPPAGPPGLEVRRRDRRRAGLRPAAGHQPLRHHHGRGPRARAEDRGRRALRVPAGHPGDPGRRRVQGPGAGQAGQPQHPRARPSPARCWPGSPRTSPCAS